MRTDMKKLTLLLALSLCFVTVCGTESQAAPAQWSFQRASVVLTAGAAQFDVNESPTVNAFLPGLGLSYSLTSQMSLVGVVERDVARDLTLGRAGARLHIADVGQGDVGFGADLVAYGDNGRKYLNLQKETSFQASLNGAWPVSRYKNGATCFWLVGSASYDPQNLLKTYRAGLRWQAIGGRPQ
jgi:hypothetical protein